MNQTIDIIEDHPSENEVQLKVSGSVNIHTSSRLRSRLKPLLSGSMRSVHVDLDGVSFMDSSGIATLVDGLKWSRATGGKFVLSGLSASVRDTFILAKLDKVFEIRETESSV